MHLYTCLYMCFWPLTLKQAPEFCSGRAEELLPNQLNHFWSSSQRCVSILPYLCAISRLVDEGYIVEAGVCFDVCQTMRSLSRKRQRAWFTLFARASPITASPLHPSFPAGDMTTHIIPKFETRILLHGDAAEACTWYSIVHLNRVEWSRTRPR